MDCMKWVGWVMCLGGAFGGKPEYNYSIDTKM